MTYRLSGRLLNKGLMGAVVALLLLMSLLVPARAELVQFVYTSDQHYGITRKAFRGLDKVSSREVNAAMVQAINTLPGITLPEDGGVRAGQPVQWADAVISTGDIANRMEGTDERLIPSATECWALFEKQYINGVSLKDRAGKAAEVLAIPGNHDVTNAVGFYKAMAPAKDNGSLLAMYNRANNTSLAPEAFDAKRDKVFLNREYGGVRLLFVQMWPDSAARAWLDAQLPTSLPESRCCCSPTISRILNQAPHQSQRFRGHQRQGQVRESGFRRIQCSKGQGNPGQGTPGACGVPQEASLHRCVFPRQRELQRVLHVGRPGQRYRHARVPRGFSHEGQCVRQGREAPFLPSGEH